MFLLQSLLLLCKIRDWPGRISSGSVQEIYGKMAIECRLQSSADEKQHGLSSAAAVRYWLRPPYQEQLQASSTRTALLGAVMLPKWTVMKFSRFIVSTEDAVLKFLSVYNPWDMATGPRAVAARRLATVALLAPPRSIQAQAYRPSARASNSRNTQDDCLMDRGPALPNHTC